MKPNKNIFIWRRFSFSCWYSWKIDNRSRTWGRYNLGTPWLLHPHGGIRWQQLHEFIQPLFLRSCRPVAHQPLPWHWTWWRAPWIQSLHSSSGAWPHRQNDVRTWIPWHALRAYRKLLADKSRQFYQLHFYYSRRHVRHTTTVRENANRIEAGQASIYFSHFKKWIVFGKYHILCIENQGLTSLLLMIWMAHVWIQ